MSQTALKIRSCLVDLIIQQFSVIQCDTGPLIYFSGEFTIELDSGLAAFIMTWNVS